MQHGPGLLNYPLIDLEAEKSGRPSKRGVTYRTRRGEKRPASTPEPTAWVAKATSDGKGVVRRPIYVSKGGWRRIAWGVTIAIVAAVLAPLLSAAYTVASPILGAISGYKAGIAAYDRRRFAEAVKAADVPYEAARDVDGSAL